MARKQYGSASVSCAGGPDWATVFGSLGIRLVSDEGLLETETPVSVLSTHTHTLIHSLTHSHSITHSLTHSITYSLTHTPPHSLIPSLRPPSHTQTHTLTTGSPQRPDRPLSSGDGAAWAPEPCGPSRPRSPPPPGAERDGAGGGVTREYSERKKGGGVFT